MTKLTFRLISLFFFAFTLHGFNLVFAQNRPDGASFVWTDDHGEGRNLHAFFRYSLLLDSVPQKAELNVYADSRYILSVNGTSLSYGPLRSFVNNPVYDTYDLADYLNEGENVIGVTVRSNGTNTYQLMLSRAGFVAWGEVLDGETSYSLATPGNWKAFQTFSREPEAPKMSFATGPMEIHDASLDPEGWNRPGFDDSEWITPVLLNDQNYWGELQPRDIPFLTHDETNAKSFLWKRSLAQDEKIYSFRIKTKDQKQGDFGTQKRVFAYTYIYSPHHQRVDVGTWWGEFFINGEGPLNRRDTPTEIINQQTMTLNLKQGWNFFFVKYDVVWASWEFYLAVPENAGLVFSADQKMDDDVLFRTAGPFTQAEEPIVKVQPLPFNSPNDLPALSVGWVDKTTADHAQNPAWNVAWSTFGQTLSIEPWQTQDIVIEPNQPTALAFDMGGKMLGRIFIEYEAPEGTRFDIAFSEDLNVDRPWVLKRAGIYTAVGHKSFGSSTRFESFKPYGLRYLQVNVTGHTEQVRIKRIGVISQLFPFELTGDFESSDPIFNDLWTLGWRTLRVCAEDTYTDTPFRERGLYAGDALPQYAITLAGSGDSRLIKRSLEVFQDHYREVFFPGAEKQEGTQGNLGDFPLITLEFFRWYVNYEQDTTFAEKLYPSYQHMMAHYQKLETINGLYIFPQIFIEWTQMRKRNTANTAANALMVRSFRNMAWLARYLGKGEDALMYSRFADALTSVILTQCWDDEAGAFHDGFADGEKIDHHYPISSAYPVLFGLTNETHHDRLRPFFAETLADIKNTERSGLATPYGGYYVLGALYEIGEVATAERFISQYWSPMVLRGNDTSWENFSDHRDGVGQGTLSHAWSGHPTYYLSTKVLGVPLLNGFDERVGEEMIIAPQSETLSFASGTVPRPEGLVKVNWHIAGDNLFVDVEAPAGLPWRVEPRGRLATYRLVVNGGHIHGEE